MPSSDLNPPDHHPGSEPTTSRPGEIARAKRILLVGWDAADWHVINPLLDGGLMPTLSRLIDGGVMGNLATLHPMVSPMLWNSIATGKTADKHGILGFAERDPAIGCRPVASVSRRTKALWNIFQQALGWRSNLVGWWASHPAEPLRGRVITDYFLRTRRAEPNRWSVPPGAIYPAEGADVYASLRMMPEEVTEELVLPFIPRAAEIDQKADQGLETFAALLSECCSIQAAATAAMETEAWDFTAVYFDAIDHFSHAFMAYHPPRQEHVPERDFEMYQGVINGIYRFHDLLLARLVDLAGPDALVVVCSDHGFQSGLLRPLGNPRDPAGPTHWHREHGMLVMHGPGVRRDERIYGATLLDIAPTLLTLTGLPMGEDMDGKVLVEALADPAIPSRIPSWDAVAGDDGRHAPDFAWTAPPEAAYETMRQLAALGYVDDPSVSRAETAESVDLETRYNLVQVHLSADRADEAVEIMEELLRRRPWESRYIHQMANCYLKAGYYRAVDELLDAAYPLETTAAVTPLVVWIMRARAKLERKRTDEAAACLRMVMNTALRYPPTWVETGRLWLEVNELDAARSCFARARELDPENANAHEGLASIHLRRHENAAAIDAALDATQLLFHLPRAHFTLGVALARQGRRDEAIIALKRAVAMQPSLLPAHRWLAALHPATDDSFLSAAYRNEAQRRSRERSAGADARRTRVERARPQPDLPSLAEREETILRARPDKVPFPSLPSGKTFAVVSGLPRSGTSLMMQMLAAAGLPSKTDGERVADEDNPEGYHEWEAIKHLAREPELLDEPDLETKALKVISALLPALPKKHRYRVIFMLRPIEEIARSQAKMIARRGTGGLDRTDAETAALLQDHRDSILNTLRSGMEVEVLEVDYPALVTDPAAWSERIANFLGRDLVPHPERMAGVVRADLHRNRGTKA